MREVVFLGFFVFYIVSAGFPVRAKPRSFAGTFFFSS